jgi:hypothetical protein
MPRKSTNYDQDFFDWTQEQALLLRSGELSQIDVSNIAEEIESLGRRDRRELVDRLETLITDLLKWRCQPGARCGNWRSAIASQRYEIELILRDSPSLRRYAFEHLEEPYGGARERTIEDLGLLQPDFPADCPFTPDQILAKDFLPEG